MTVVGNILRKRGQLVTESRVPTPKAVSNKTEIFSLDEINKTNLMPQSLLRTKEERMALTF